MHRSRAGSRAAAFPVSPRTGQSTTEHRRAVGKDPQGGEAMCSCVLRRRADLPPPKDATWNATIRTE